MKKGLPRKQLIDFLGEMLLIRGFEEKVTERFRAGDQARRRVRHAALEYALAGSSMLVVRELA
jgi:TPP-dependent pyruvate/acetoin dehydrogenase alpha subunit